MPWPQSLLQRIAVRFCFDQEACAPTRASRCSSQRRMFASHLLLRLPFRGDLGWGFLWFDSVSMELHPATRQ
ncbi:unnamed protein product [Victoria cruziana]